MKRVSVATKQRKISEKSLANILPYQYRKGQTGNPNGRPAGKTLKEYTRERLAAMTDDEREDFLDGLPKDAIWRMAEGNPQTDVTSAGKAINPTPILANLTQKTDD